MLLSSHSSIESWFRSIQFMFDLGDENDGDDDDDDGDDNVVDNDNRNKRYNFLILTL